MMTTNNDTPTQPAPLASAGANAAGLTLAIELIDAEITKWRDSIAVHKDQFIYALETMKARILGVMPDETNSFYGFSTPDFGIAICAICGETAQFYRDGNHNMPVCDKHRTAVAQSPSPAPTDAGPSIDVTFIGNARSRMQDVIEKAHELGLISDDDYVDANDKNNELADILMGIQRPAQPPAPAPTDAAALLRFKVGDKVVIAHDNDDVSWNGHTATVVKIGYHGRDYLLRDEVADMNIEYDDSELEPRDDQPQPAPAVSAATATGKAVRLSKAQREALHIFSLNYGHTYPKVIGVRLATALALQDKGLLHNNGRDFFQITPAGKAAIGRR